MPNVYGQNTKITDVVGRSRYISGESDKQEEVIVHEKNMMYDWSFYSAYEREMRIKKIKDRTRRGNDNSLA